MRVAGNLKYEYLKNGNIEKTASKWGPRNFLVPHFHAVFRKKDSSVDK